MRGLETSLDATEPCNYLGPCGRANITTDVPVMRICTRVTITNQTASHAVWLSYVQCFLKRAFQNSNDHDPAVLASTAPTAHARPSAMCGAGLQPPCAISKTSDVLKMERPARPPKT